MLSIISRRCQVSRASHFSRSIARSGTGFAPYNNQKNASRSLFSSLQNADNPNPDNLPSATEKNYPIDFAKSSKIEGEESQIAIIKLRPGETLRAESGSMIFMTQGIEMTTNMDGASSAFRRMMTGQNVFLTDFTYNSTEDSNGYGSVALGTDFPSKITRLSLDEYGGNLIAQRGAFLASNASVDIQMEFTRTMTAGFFGGQGFILQRLVGEGDVLIKAGGTLIERELKDGEVLRVTSGSIVAFESKVSYDTQMVQGVKNVMFGGEGLFMTTLTGPGRVWLQGMPPDRMIAEIATRVPSSGGGIVPVIPIGGMGGSGGGVEGAPVDTGGASAMAIDGVSTNEGTMSEASSPSPGAADGDLLNYSNTSGEGEVAQETTFTDGGADFAEPNFSDSTSFNSEEFGQNDEKFFGDDEAEIFDTGNVEEASEAGSSILSTLWDTFTGSD